MSARGRAAALSAALVVVTALAYLPAVSAGGFVWDDDDYVTDNRTLHEPGGLAAIWTSPGATPQYYPLTFTTFWIEYRLWGLEPAGYHAVNVALHATAAVLLFLLLRALGVPGAWLGAALFALHPVHVESVAWITERKNVLSGALYLGSLVCWVRYFRLDAGQRPAPREVCDHRSPWLAAAGALLYVGALLSKTVTSTLPLTLALLFWWRRRRPRPTQIALLLAMLAGGALLGSLTSLLERVQVGAVGEEWSLDAVERAMVAGRAWWFYLGKLALPAGLSFVYPRWTVAAGDPAALAWPLSAALALGALWALRGRLGRGPLVALLHYSVALAPALGFFDVYPMRFSWVADHFQYLASAGPLALTAAAAARLARRWPRPLALGGVALLLLALAVPTWQRAGIYRDAETLWRETLERNPDAWLAHHNLGSILLERGESDEAERHLRRVIELRPSHVPSRMNLGVMLLREATLLAARGESGQAAQRLAEAETLLARALELDPLDFNTHANLGDVRLRRGDVRGAERAYLDAVRLRPRHPHARAGLGRIRLAEGRYAEAVEQFEIALRSFPDEPEALFNLATAEALAGRTAEALAHYTAVLDLEPDHIEARLSRGTLLAQLGRLDDAERDLIQVLRLDPDNPMARRNLAVVRELREEP